MKKNIMLRIIILLFFTIFFASDSFCQVIKTKIIGTSEDKLYVATDENIVINGGKNFGIIKGDILSIFKKDAKPPMDDEIGRCVVVKNEKNTSICNIIKSKIEIGKGDFVILKKLKYSDPKLYPLIYAALNEIVEPYENHRHIRVYIHNIYDEKNNITEFSQMIKEQILDIFSKKERLLLDTSILNEYMGYQDDYFYSDIDSSKQGRIFNLKKKMEQFKIDVVITGYYTVKNDVLMVKLFIVDKNWEDKSVKDFLSAKDYYEKISKIIIPYKPFKEKEFVNYKFILNIKDYLPDLDEQREIIKLESEKEMNFRFKFINSKLKFNRISPSDINVKVNNELITEIHRGDVYEKSFEKGLKRILVSFIPTLYDNELEIISLKKEIKKEILVDLKDENDIYVEIFLDSTYGKESADIKVIRKKIDEKIKLSPVKTVKEKLPTIELYRD
ncbi:MAG TPA: hypothetical protein PKZ54_04420 [Syntrophorhabdaceae bacterium]|nr:hypothetical protein [Syntrophorhabdaceae bacterium]